MGVKQDLVVLICLSTSEAKHHTASCDGVVFPFPAGCPKEDRNVKGLFFGLMMSIFQKRSGEYPTEFIANYYKDLGVIIGMTHL